MRSDIIVLGYYCAALERLKGIWMYLKRLKLSNNCSFTDIFWIDGDLMEGFRKVNFRKDGFIVKAWEYVSNQRYWVSIVDCKGIKNAIVATRSGRIVSFCYNENCDAEERLIIPFFLIR